MLFKANLLLMGETTSSFLGAVASMSDAPAFCQTNMDGYIYDDAAAKSSIDL